MRLINSGMAALACLLVSGCSSPLFEGSIFDQRGLERNKSELAKIKTSSEMTNVECQRLSEQIDALNRNQLQIDNRLRGIETELGSAGRESQQNMLALRQELANVRIEREQLRGQITQDLTTKIEKIAAQQQQAIQSAQQQAQVAAAASASHTSGSSSNTGSGYEHKVKSGQTLTEIARGYNTTVSKIIKANNIKNPSSIRAGQTLFIPD